MTTPTLNYYTKATLTLKHKQTLATKTVSFTTRHIDSWDTFYIPNLLEVSRLGQVHDRIGPTDQSGTIKILDDLNSYGADRKFSDLLQRYTIINQDCTISTGTSSLTVNVPSAWVTRYKGKIVDFEAGKEGNKSVISIRIESRIFERRLITKTIDSESFSGLPNESNNRALPLVLGTAEVIPLKINTAVSPEYDTTYAYCSTLDDQYVPVGVEDYYCKDTDGVFREVHGAASTGTLVYGNDLSGLTYNAGPGYTSPETDTREKFALDIEWVDTKKHIITHGFMVFRPAASATQYGTLTFEIRENKAGGTGPGKVIASSIVEKSDLTWTTGSTPKTVQFAFSEPVILSAATKYFLSVAQKSTNGSSHIQPASYTPQAGEESWSWSNGSWFKYRNTIDGPYMEKYYGLYGIKFDDQTVPTSDLINSDGIGHAYVTMTQHTSLSYATSPDISKLQFIFNVAGIKDDTSGTITGTPDQQLSGAKHQLQLLDLVYTGGSWQPDLFDDSAYSDTHEMIDGSTAYLARLSSGQTEGRAYQEETLKEVCENNACRLVLRNDGSLAVWAWGRRSESQSFITHDDCKLLRYWSVDGSFIANQITIEYVKKYSLSNGIITDANGVGGIFSACYAFKDTSNEDLRDLIVGNSQELFGKRPLATQARPFVGDESSANILALYYAAVFNEPPQYVEIELPLHRFDSLQPMDVIELQLPGLPCFYGSSAKAKLPNYNGNFQDVTSGYPLTRAETYRAQIESRYINIIGAEGPKLTLVCKLLLNSLGDPT